MRRTACREGTGAVFQATNAIAEAMEKAGISPAMVYAFRKTGRLITEDNYDLVSWEALAEWDAAIAEYDTRARA